MRAVWEVYCLLHWCYHIYTFMLLYKVEMGVLDGWISSGTGHNAAFLSPAKMFTFFTFDQLSSWLRHAAPATSAVACVYVCSSQHMNAYVLATGHVHPRATHGQPLYSATVALAKSLAAHTAAGNCGVRKGTSPQFSEGHREASLGWQSLKRGLAGWGSWLTVFDSRTCQYQRLMIKAALVCHRGCHLSYSYR